MTHKCMRTGCINDAIGVVKMNVPISGAVGKGHKPHSAIVGIHICEEHFINLTPDLLLRNELKEAFKVIGGDKTPPDFARAFVTLVQEGSDEYTSWLTLIERNKRS